MAGQRTRRAPTLRTSILLLILCGFIAVAVPAYWGFTTLVNTTVVQLGRLFAEKQILFDRYRGLGALMQEVALAETLTRSPVIRDWARNESDPDKQALAIAELEQYRNSLSWKVTRPLRWIARLLRGGKPKPVVTEPVRTFPGRPAPAPISTAEEPLSDR